MRGMGSGRRAFLRLLGVGTQRQQSSRVVVELRRGFVAARGRQGSYKCLGPLWCSTSGFGMLICSTPNSCHPRAVIEFLMAYTDRRTDSGQDCTSQRIGFPHPLVGLTRCAIHGLGRDGQEHQILLNSGYALERRILGSIGNVKRL